MAIIPFNYWQIPNGFNELNSTNILKTESPANVSEVEKLYYTNLSRCVQSDQALNQI